MTLSAPSGVRPPRLLTLILLAALAVLPTTIILPSLANIAREYDVDYALVSLSIAGFAAVSAVLQLVLGPVSDRFGRRPVVLVALLAFALASFGCGLAPDLWTFLACRLLQAVVASGYVAALAAIRDTCTPNQAASRIGYVAMAWSLAPILGPMVGGLIDEVSSWRMIFHGLGLAALAVWLLCWLDLRETRQQPANTLAQQFRTYPALVRDGRFWAYALCMAFTAGTFYAYLTGAPLMASARFDMAPAALGFYMGLITVGFMAGSFVAGRYGSSMPLARMMILGRWVALAGPLLAGLLLAMGLDQPMAFFGPCMLIGLGNGITIPSANTGAMSVHPRLAGSAAGLAGAVSVAGGALMAGVTGMVLTEASVTWGLILILLLATVAAMVAAQAADRLGSVAQDLSRNGGALPATRTDEPRAPE